MGSRIPSTIRKEVIREWLDGLTREKIASKNQIGAATAPSSVNVDKPILISIFYGKLQLISEETA